MENLEKDIREFKLSLLDHENCDNPPDHSFTTKSLTMVGYKNLSNVEDLFKIIVENNIDGDLVETGVWKGGVVILMAYLNRIYKQNRQIFACDSYEGLPKDSEYEQDRLVNGNFSQYDYAISLEEVKSNFDKYNLLDDKITFIKGFFENSLVNSNINKISILRLDGDMYTSTISVLDALYDKVSIGGAIIIDDYDWKDAGCGNAVDYFRGKRNIKTNMVKSYANCVWWIKE